MLFVCLFVFLADKSSNITKNSWKPSCFLSVYQWSFKQSIKIFCFTWHNPILYNFRASHFSKLCKLRLFLELKIGEETKFVWILRFPYFFIFLVSGRATGPVIQGNPTSLYFFLVKGEYFCAKLSVAEYVVVFILQITTNVTGPAKMTRLQRLKYCTDHVRSALSA